MDKQKTYAAYIKKYGSCRCHRCNALIQEEDLEEVEYIETKRKEKLWIHRKCVGIR